MSIINSATTIATSMLILPWKFSNLNTYQNRDLITNLRELHYVVFGWICDRNQGRVGMLKHVNTFGLLSLTASVKDLGVLVSEGKDLMMMVVLKASFLY